MDKLKQIQQKQVLDIKIDDLNLELKDNAAQYKNAQNFLIGALDDIEGNSTKFTQLILLASALNMMDFKLWNKIFVKFYKGYETSSIPSKHFNVNMVNRFLQKFMNAEFLKGAEYKFMYL